MAKKNPEIITPGIIEHLKISELSAYKKNARTHSEYQIEKLVCSIKEFGFTNPILITDDNVVIAGHGRLAAAQKLKMLEVPCIRLSHLTDAQRRAYVIADNRLALDAGWDEEILREELNLLMEEASVEISATGFDRKELDALLQEADPLSLEDETGGGIDTEKETYHCPKCGFEFEVVK